MTGVLFLELAYGLSQPFKSPASCDLKLSLDFGINHSHAWVHTLTQKYIQRNINKNKAILRKRQKEKNEVKGLRRARTSYWNFFSSRMFKKVQLQVKMNVAHFKHYFLPN